MSRDIFTSYLNLDGLFSHNRDGDKWVLRSQWRLLGRHSCQHFSLQGSCINFSVFYSCLHFILYYWYHSVYIFRILSVGECASAPWLMVCSLREMVTSLASVSIRALFICLLVNMSLSCFSLITSSYLQQVDLADVNSIMEVAGMKLEMDILTLRVWLVVINSIHFFFFLILLPGNSCRF